MRQGPLTFYWLIVYFFEDFSFMNLIKVKSRGKLQAQPVLYFDVVVRTQVLVQYSAGTVPGTYHTNSTIRGDTPPVPVLAY
jgi:hypothetical protein